jgi:2-polyprenyl-3-methyl-5-hydroxy-6-metoxy-1,4-benzoquinol methylase
MNPDMNKVEAFAGQVVTDIAATFSGVMTNLGHRLGLYKAMAGAGPLSAGQLAEKTDTHPRYVREWLNNQVAGTYVEYDAETDTYVLPDAHVPVLADEDSPVFLIPALDVASSLWMDEEKVGDVFRSGEGIAWGEHHHRLFCGSEALFRPGYKAHLVGGWLGSLDGVEDKLMAGARVADVGCGHGASTIVMAKSFPRSVFYGFDSHPESIETARRRAREEGVQANTRFVVSSAQEYEEDGFDLICLFDCLHDMGDPVGAADHARRALAADGSVLLVEPAAADDLDSNINPVSRLYYAASTAVCTPCSLSQEVGLALGAQAGQKRLSAVMDAAGFGRTVRAAETPFNIVLDCRVA